MRDRHRRHGAPDLPPKMPSCGSGNSPIFRIYATPPNHHCTDRTAHRNSIPKMTEFGEPPTFTRTSPTECAATFGTKCMTIDFSCHPPTCSMPSITTPPTFRRSITMNKFKFAGSIIQEGGMQWVQSSNSTVGPAWHAYLAIVEHTRYEIRIYVDAQGTPTCHEIMTIDNKLLY
jgi:hypothetical protein